MPVDTDDQQVDLPQPVVVDDRLVVVEGRLYGVQAERWEAPAGVRLRAPDHQEIPEDAPFHEQTFWDLLWRRRSGHVDLAAYLLELLLQLILRGLIGREVPEPPQRRPGLRELGALEHRLVLTELKGRVHAKAVQTRSILQEGALEIGDVGFVAVSLDLFDRFAAGFRNGPRVLE